MQGAARWSNEDWVVGRRKQDASSRLIEQRRMEGEGGSIEY